MKYYRGQPRGPYMARPAASLRCMTVRIQMQGSFDVCSHSKEQLQFIKIIIILRRNIWFIDRHYL